MGLDQIPSFEGIAGKGALNRFSDRVENYIKYRPDYPVEIITFLNQEGLLKPESVIADIGSGTGISTELFLKQHHVVYGIEPNKEMREAAERLLVNYKNFKSISGTAESTTLSSNSIDLIAAGQAFHWFDKTKSKAEFERILKPGGNVVLIWNDRRTNNTPFLKSYEECIKKFAIDYDQVNHKNIDHKIFDGFYGAGNYKIQSFDHFQYFDFEGLKGRLLSSSYIPTEGHADFNNMINALKKIVEQFQENGKVTIEYDTKIYYGKLK